MNDACPKTEVLVVKSLAELRASVARAWCSQTSNDPANWNSENPAWGQCVVTALMVQEVYGGDLLRATIRGLSHYWNILPDGEVIDLTIQQFGSDAMFDDEPESRSRDYALSSSNTSERYSLLRSRVSDDLCGLKRRLKSE